MMRTRYQFIPVTLVILVFLSGLAGCSTPGRVHRSASRMHARFCSCMEAYDQNERYCQERYDRHSTFATQCRAGAETAREECVKRAH